MNFCAFDIETLGEQSKFRSGALSSDVLDLYTEDPWELLQALLAHVEAGYVLVAHNAEYEVTNLLWRYGQDVSVHYYSGAFVCAYWRWRKRGSAGQVWDSLGLSAHLSLSELGRSLGLSKLETPQALKGQDPDRYRWFCEAHDRGECVECYNLRDAQIVARYMAQLSQFLAAYNLPVKRTIAGNAVQLWQTLDVDAQQSVRSENVRRLAGAAYHGGRTENYKYGTYQNVWTYDHRWHYASVMADCPMPDCRSLLYVEAPGRLPELEGIEGVIEAEVIYPETRFPVLPVVSSDAIYYPVGRFRGSWAICELRAAMARGVQLVRVYRMAWSKQTVYPFTRFMGGLGLYREELQARDDPMQAVVKTLMNALPGRLGVWTGGEKRIYQRRVLGMKPDQLRGRELRFANGNSYLEQVAPIPNPPPTANILWAANVTAWGRLRLLESLELADVNAVYCDTDSVFSLAELPSYLDVPGRLRPTGRYDTGTFLGPKLYRLESYDGSTLLRAKGVPERVAESYFLEGRALYDTPLGVIEAIGRGLEPGWWHPIEKTRKLAPARRWPVNPGALLDRSQTSETFPIVFAGEGPIAVVS